MYCSLLVSVSMVPGSDQLSMAVCSLACSEQLFVLNLNYVIILSVVKCCAYKLL